MTEENKYMAWPEKPSEGDAIMTTGHSTIYGATAGWHDDMRYWRVKTRTEIEILEVDVEGTVISP